MKINNPQNELLKHLESCKPNWSLPQAFYNDENIFQADLENLFYSEWIFIGHDCQIPDVGDFFRYEIGDYDIIVLRAEDNSVKAFHNTCRHRGSRLCKEDKGHKPQLVCPYHQWTYDLSGKLKYAKDMGEDFNPNDHKLHSVNCETIEGIIYLCLSDDAPEFESFKKTVTPYLEKHRLHDAKIVHESSIIEEGNWKLVLENNRECYHCAGSHPELCRTYSDDPSFTGIPDESDPTLGMVQEHWDKCDTLNIPAKFHLSDDGQYRVTRMPLQHEAESFTMDGKVASKKLMVDSTDKELGTLLFFHYPNTWNHFLSDHSITFCVTPLSTNRTKVTTRWLVHKDAVEGKDYDLETLIAVWKATNQQDLELVEENQKGIRSPNYTPGPYSVVQEDGVIQFINWYQQISQQKASAVLNAHSLDKTDNTVHNADNKIVYIEDLPPTIPGELTPAIDLEKAVNAANTPATAPISPQDSTLFENTTTHHDNSAIDLLQKANLKNFSKKSEEDEEDIEKPSFDQNKIPHLYLDQSQPWEAQSSMLKLINIVPETHDVITFTFRTHTNNWFSFAPGQFITLELPMPGEKIYRTYTISSSPSRPLSLSITVKLNPNSIGSKWMFENLKLGMELRAFGPAGEFHLYNHDADKYCFISGGSGITPMLSMTKYLFDRGGELDISFIHCARSPSNIIAKEQVERLSTRFLNFQIAWIVEDREPFLPWTGYTGRINQLILELTTPDFFEREIYCCGPAIFMQTVRDILIAADFDMSHYHEESFDMPVLEEEKVAHDDVFLDESIKTTVSFLNSERTLPSNQKITLLETSLEAGLNIPSACQFGVCGTCKVKKKSGDVHMVHNGGISDKEVDDGYILACCSYPLNDVEIQY
ncbi:SRPBCC family protein [Cocleimonas flava]|nr:SRPBCC family protein [Cocleimonas flava]